MKLIGLMIIYIYCNFDELNILYTSELHIECMCTSELHTECMCTNLHMDE